MAKNYLHADAQAYECIDRYLSESGGEFANEEQERMYDRLQWSVPKNLDGAISVLKEYQADIASVELDIKKSKAYKLKKEAALNRLKNEILFALKTLEIKSHGSGRGRVSIFHPADCLPDVIDEKKVPSAFMTEAPKPEDFEPKIKRGLLLEAIKAGVVLNIELVTNRTSLKIG